MYQNDNRLAHSELERRAIHGIENGDVLQRSDGIRRRIALHMFIKGRYPISYKGWTIYQHSNPEEYNAASTYSVMKAGWNWSADTKRAAQTPPAKFKPVPTWNIKQAPLERAEIEAWFSRDRLSLCPLSGCEVRSAGMALIMA